MTPSDETVATTPDEIGSDLSVALGDPSENEPRNEFHGLTFQVRLNGLWL